MVGSGAGGLRRRCRLGFNRMCALDLLAKFFETPPQFFNLTVGIGQFGTGLPQFLTELKHVGRARAGILPRRMDHTEAQTDGPQDAKRLEGQSHGTSCLIVLS